MKHNQKDMGNIRREQKFLFLKLQNPMINELDMCAKEFE